MKAFLLAAGMGKRLRPLTDTVPKPLIKVAGVPLIIRHIQRLKEAGVTEFVINTHWLAETLHEELGDGAKMGVQIYWSHEEALLETGGGIKKAMPLIGRDPFILVSADTWTDFDFQQLVSNPLSPGDAARLVLVDNPEHNRAGDFILEKVEPGAKFPNIRMPDGTSSTYTYSGIALLDPEWISSWQLGRAFPLREPLFAAIENNRLSGLHHQGIWTDVGSMERLQAIRDQLEVE
jgi:MurNAc alpha-1-phosphate uridylyltransferase